MSDYLEMVRLDPQWRCFFDDGTVLDLKDDVREMAASLEGREPGLGARFTEFMELSEKLHTISDKFFFWKSVGSMRDTFDIGGSFQLSVLKDVLSMRLGQSVSGTIREFIKDPRVAQMLDHYVQYVGSSPDNSPAILCSIGHMQAEQGIWYPQGRHPCRSPGAGSSGQRAGRALPHLDRDCASAHRGQRYFRS